MSGETGNSGWTLLLLRRGGVRAFSAELGKKRFWVLLAGAILGVLLAGVLVGYWMAEAGDTRELRALEDRVEQLHEERSEVARLASRLRGIDRDYRRLRRVMGGEVASSGRDVELPPLPAGGAAATGDDRTSSSGSHEWPLARPGFVTRSYGEAAGDEAEAHEGLDIAVPTGSYVRASREGTVREAGEDPVYGRYARILHPDGLTSLYGHNRWLFVSAGDEVERGEVIALSGSSGQSTAPHLHFELRRDGAAVDPADRMVLER